MQYIGSLGLCSCVYQHKCIHRTPSWDADRNTAISPVSYGTQQQNFVFTRGPSPTGPYPSQKNSVHILTLYFIISISVFVFPLQVLILKFCMYFSYLPCVAFFANPNFLDFNTLIPSGNKLLIMKLVMQLSLTSFYFFCLRYKYSLQRFVRKYA